VEEKEKELTSVFQNQTQQLRQELLETKTELLLTQNKLKEREGKPK
jgi:hypothetical protein